MLLPCRNAAATLDAALASIAWQTLSDFEVVAVDDGSDDDTPSILANWVDRDSRINAISTPPRGIVAALNAAAEYARCDVLARMDADDIAAPQRLERQLAFLDTHQDLSACGSRIRYMPRERLKDGALRYEQWINSVVTVDDMERDLFVECPIPHPTLVMRKAVFDAVGGYRDNGWPEDYDLLLRFWESDHRFGKVPDVLLDWCEGPDRLSRTDSRYSEDAFRACKVHFLRSRIAGRSVVVCGAGPIGKTFARALQREDHDVVAFVDVDPRKIGQIIHGAPVIQPPAIGDYRAAYVVAAVGSPGAREEIRASLRNAGLDEPEEFCAVA